MQLRSDLVINAAKRVVWASSGFLMRADATKGAFSVVTFEDLNPHVTFKRVLTRGEMFRIGLWFIRMALRRRLE